MSADHADGGWRRSVLVCVAVVLGYVLVGALAGVIWEWVWTPPQQVVQNHQLYYLDYDSLRRVFSGTGLYVIVATVASALMGVVACLLARHRELLMLAAVIVGSLAAAYAMHAVGISLSPADPATLAASQPDGTQVSGALEVSGRTAYLIWPMVSLFVLSLVFFAWPARVRDPEPGPPAEAPEAELDPSVGPSSEPHA